MTILEYITKHYHRVCRSSRNYLIIIIGSNWLIWQFLLFKWGVILVVALRPVIRYVNRVILQISRQYTRILVDFLHFLGFWVRRWAINDKRFDFFLKLHNGWVYLIFEALSLVCNLLLYQIDLVVSGSIALCDPRHLLHVDALLDHANLFLHVLVVPLFYGIKRLQVIDASGVAVTLRFLFTGLRGKTFLADLAAEWHKQTLIDQVPHELLRRIALTILIRSCLAVIRTLESQLSNLTVLTIHMLNMLLILHSNLLWRPFLPRHLLFTLTLLILLLLLLCILCLPLIFRLLLPLGSRGALHLSIPFLSHLTRFHMMPSIFCSRQHSRLAAGVCEFQLLEDEGPHEIVERLAGYWYLRPFWESVGVAAIPWVLGSVAIEYVVLWAFHFLDCGVARVVLFADTRILPLLDLCILILIEAVCAKDLVALVAFHDVLALRDALAN